MNRYALGQRLEGTPCTVNSKGDLFMIYEARPFIGAECEFVKITKGGLVMVRLKADPKQTISVPQRNVDLT